MGWDQEVTAAWEETEEALVMRWLQENEDSEFSNSTNSTATLTDTEILETTLTVYGCIFLFLLLLFCAVRRKFPRVFNIRNWVESLKTDIAADQFGFISWIWKVFSFSDDTLREECGMDGICLIRILQFGMKLAIVGMLNAIWLMPMYNRGGSEQEGDPIKTVSVANIEEKSNILIGTVIAAWIIFGYCMYGILGEFEWFTRARHLYLERKAPQNYTVYVRNVPEEYVDNAKFKEFFNKAYEDSVVESNLTIECPNLGANVVARDKCVLDLEHAHNMKKSSGVAPEKKSGCFPRKSEGDLIEHLTKELEDLNKEVSDSIEKMEAIANSSSDVEAVPKQEEAGGDEKRDSSLMGGVKSLLTKEDGKILTSGFVTFKTLRATNAALQQTQCPTPFDMEVLEAPLPEDLIWANVGKTHKELQLGKLLSNALTVALCLLWTIPMSFFAALSSVQGLVDLLPFLEDWIEKAPWLENLLAQLAPLLIVVAKKLVEILCILFSTRELPISNGDLSASTYIKMSWFMIIQTFFVSAISGSIFTELDAIVDNPTSIIELLGKSLPSQSMYFIQIMLVDSGITLGVELLRFSAAGMAIARAYIGPNLSEKESNTTFLGIRPLADPEPFRYHLYFSNMVLYFMVYLVYATIAPITSFIVGICFFFMSATYRHQFIYIYPTFPDSGGKMWISFFGLLPTMMIIAEIAIVGMLALQKSPIASAMMFPLVVVTILFSVYIKQQHFRVAAFIPARDAMLVDEKNEGDSLEFLQGQYIQPELREKTKLPETDNAVEVGNA